MADQLWQHSLQFLENCRTSTSYYGIAHLYSFEDTTGILERHRDMFENSFLDGQVGMKSIFQELIRMLLDHDKRNDDVTEISSLDGFQDLTNRLQHHLNLSFIKDLQEIKQNKFEGKSVHMEKKLQLVEQDAFVILEKMLRIEEENQFLMEKINILEKSERQSYQKISGEQSSSIGKLYQMVEKHEKEISKFLDNDNKDSMEERNANENDKLEKDNKMLRDGFNFQEQFETFENEISELTELRILEMSDEVAHTAKQMAEQRRWMEESIDRLARKCQENLIQNQTDIISNTKEITKVIENQILLKEKIKLMEGNDEQTSKPVDSSRFCTEPTSLHTGKDDEQFLNIEESINGICCELKTIRAEHKNSTKENMKATEILNNEIENINITVKKIKEQAADDKINENISNLASDLSHLTKELKKHKEVKDAAEKSIRDRITMIKHEQDTTNTSVDRINSLIDRMGEGMKEQDGRLNKTTSNVSDLETTIGKFETEKNEIFKQLQILDKSENKLSFQQIEETKSSLKTKMEELENMSKLMTKNIEDNEETFTTFLATAEDKLAVPEESNHIKRECLNKTDTLCSSTFIPSPDVRIEKVVEAENLIERVIKEDNEKEKVVEEDDLIERVVDNKTSVDGQSEKDLKLKYKDSKDEDTRHKTSGSSPSGSKLGRWLKKRKQLFINTDSIKYM